MLYFVTNCWPKRVKFTPMSPQNVTFCHKLLAAPVHFCSCAESERYKKIFVWGEIELKFDKTEKTGSRAPRHRYIALHISVRTATGTATFDIFR